MRIRAALLAVVALVVPALVSVPGAEAATPSAQAGAKVPGELIVRFSGRAGAHKRDSLRRAAGVHVKRALPAPGVQLVKVDPGQSVHGAGAELEASRDVVYAEPNFYRRVAAVPSDSYFGYLWGLDNQGQTVNGTTGTPDGDIDAPEAWNITTGSSNVTAAVIDTGLNFSQPDLSSKVWTNPGETGGGRETNGVDDDADGYVDDWRGWDFVTGDNLPADENGHGTHVSGTIAASPDNGGIVGVSWASKVLPLRVLDASGSGTVADLISAYDYAIARGVRVVNLSLGGPDFSQAELDAITSAPNTLFVVAAGNGGADGVGDNVETTPEYPCADPAPNVVCVAASDQHDGLASFSNYGSATVDLAAPGVNVLSTVLGSGFAFYDGTSMATPHATGVASLVLALQPGASTAAVKADLLGGTDAKPAFAGKTVSGGRLNALRALQLADPSAVGLLPPPESPPPDPAPEPNPSPDAAPAAADVTPPALTIRTPSSQRLGAVLSRGLALRTRCSERCGLTVRLLLDGRTAGRLRLARSGRQAEVGRASARVSTGSTRLVVRLSRRARSKLKRVRRATITVSAVAVDGAGNARRMSLRVSLRR